MAKIGKAYDKISPPLALAGLSIPIVTGGLILEDKKLLETSRLMVESFLVSGVITQLGKILFGRTRPYTDEGPTEFAPWRITAKTERRSFPSGHTSSAFSVMTFLAKQYDHWWVKVPAYTAAASVALQRIDSRNHWGADVVVGGAVGYWVASTLVNRYPGNSNISRSHRSSISSYVFGNRLGVCWEF